MIRRENILGQIRPFLHSDPVKILTGIRGCGKSVILEQIAEELRKSGKRTLMLNFENRTETSDIATDAALVDFVDKHLGADKLYVFLDEVQLIRNWQLACRTLRLKNVSLFIAASNAGLLSRQYTQELSGRYVAFRVRPFVFKEAAAYAWKLGRELSVTDYLVWGGLPKVQELLSDKAAVCRYLTNLEETIVNEILIRYRIRKPELFRRLVNLVLISNSRILSAQAVLRTLKREGFECSINTVMKFMGYLKEAYLIHEVPVYSAKDGRTLKFYSKFYVEDVAFNSMRQDNRFDLEHSLENTVYNQLVSMGYNVSVFKDGEREIDFLAIKDGKEYLVQTAYSIVDESICRRAFAPFDKLDQSRRKILITNDDLDYSTSTVDHIRLKDFLRMESL